MKRNTLFILSLIIMGSLSFAATRFAATTWNLDKTHSAISFEARHFFTSVPGAFEEYEANIAFDPENLEESSLSVSIDVASINTKNERRDGHLMTADFFEAETYPNISFTSEKIVSTGDNNFEAHGKLTIKEVTTDFVMPFTLLGVMDSPFQENTLIAGFTSEFSLMRNDYGVGTGDWVSDAIIGDEIKVKVDVEVNTAKN
ncbi:MAG: polyisoprenoid-binding protein [Bacteroidetes bacterium]|jgi:polyisoprenoid-binding protein YceI|nr:polyisoprenoid-binding protein [Bacteroidota bacterium]